MRSVFVFPTGERAGTVALLDRFLPQQRDPWILDGNLYLDIDDEQTGYLFSAWEPTTWRSSKWPSDTTHWGRSDRHLRWIDGTAEVHQLVALLLAHGGVTTDDYSAHPWTLQELESGAVIDGLRFFDFRTYHELNPEHGRC